MWRCGIGWFGFSFYPLFVSLAVKSSWYFPGTRTEASFRFVVSVDVKTALRWQALLWWLQSVFIGAHINMLRREVHFPSAGIRNCTEDKSATRVRLKWYWIRVTSVGCLLNSRSLRSAWQWKWDLCSITRDNRDGCRGRLRRHGNQIQLATALLLVVTLRLWFCDAVMSRVWHILQNKSVFGKYIKTETYRGISITSCKRSQRCLHR